MSTHCQYADNSSHADQWRWAAGEGHKVSSKSTKNVNNDTGFWLAICGGYFDDIASRLEWHLPPRSFGRRESRRPSHVHRSIAERDMSCKVNAVCVGQTIGLRRLPTLRGP